MDGRSKQGGDGTHMAAWQHTGFVVECLKVGSSLEMGCISAPVWKWDIHGGGGSEERVEGWGAHGGGRRDSTTNGGGEEINAPVEKRGECGAAVRGGEEDTRGGGRGRRDWSDGGPRWGAGDPAEGPRGRGLRGWGGGLIGGGRLKIKEGGKTRKSEEKRGMVGQPRSGLSFQLVIRILITDCIPL